MQFKNIQCIHRGAYLFRYDVSYLNPLGEEQSYEMVSRRKELTSLRDLQNKDADAVVMIIRNESDDRFLLIREFRMELGCEIYGLPGGLIEAGESPEETAVRELAEETGLTLSILERSYPAAACAVGIGDEKTVCVFGRACGTLRDQIEGSEEIHAAWYTREEVLKLQETALFGSWALAYSRIWAEDPFGRSRSHEP